MLCKAQVSATDPDNYSVYCFLCTQAGQGPTVPVRVLVPGACDGVRINQAALPGRGTIGVVGALDGDPRALVWLGAVPANANDGINTIPGQNNLEHMKHFSGYWELLDEAGNTTMYWPDSSNMVIGPTSGVLNNHRVVNGTRQVQTLAPGGITANKPSPFPVTFTHSTGTYINIDPSGNVTVSSVAAINASAATTINAFAGNSINAKSPVVNVTGSTTVNITSPVTTVYGELRVTGPITAGYGTGDQVGVQTHNHSQGNDSRGDTEQNTSAPIAGS
jgi:hypothetical protein